jgi:hypothetical protein
MLGIVEYILTLVIQHPMGRWVIRLHFLLHLGQDLLQHHFHQPRLVRLEEEEEAKEGDIIEVTVVTFHRYPNLEN